MQGFNMGRYVPPDVEGTLSANRLHAKHPLGPRARKSALGILTVRFEMPFAIWCTTCPRPTLIAQGVRFNAEKARVGAYYSTPVWRFRFKHAECGGGIEMRTDPKNTAYVVVSGARKRDTGDDDKYGAIGNGDAKFASEEEQRQSAFASLEKTIEDRQALKMAAARIDGLRDMAARQWEDPYAQNQRLRRAFRKGRKEREARAAEDDALRERMGLAEGVEIAPETEEDARRARLVDFGGGGAEGGESDDKTTLARPLFGGQARERAGGRARGTKGVKGRQELVSKLVASSRAASDPFLQGKGERPLRTVLGVKRKRDGDAAGEARVSSGLVAYDSD